eukprot:CAMPEP_0181181432 /NCGR_PEP_ID=MMETSP1096-20121128/7336_1 /TAXON_ID=156174 ORGANISM="Chrysochromulina ericina, Strain CCMP281" /NCGR_SAMPLE_ID=MMETSP1096 /ASSEMBLY_ACC=CAM_ASM_000453 /LENGTH=201 /DNA_ID=CAMNT_0023269939 /DNA_START=89 /DNA_END=694 /DNA_ORIENTATION=+
MALLSLAMLPLVTGLTISHSGCTSRRVHRVMPQCCVEVVADSIAGPFPDEFWERFCEEAEQEAERMGMSIADISFKSGTLNVQAAGAGVDELQSLNRHLSSFLDAEEAEAGLELPLEVSSPGVSPSLTSEIDFSAFKGFEVEVTMTEPHKGKDRFSGTLVGRDEEHVTINLKGRMVNLPRATVGSVQLPTAKTESGDPYRG